jgi:hypothetical protein
MPMLWVRASLIVVSVVSGIKFADSSSSGLEGNTSLSVPSRSVELLSTELRVYASSRVRLS